MKNLKVFFLTVTMVLTIVMGTVYAKEQTVGSTASVSVFSNYVWRGQKLSNSFVVQPSVSVSYDSFNFSIWSNMDSDYNDTFEHTETDFTLDYAFSVEKFTFSTGYIYYGLEGAADTQEIYLSVGYDMPLSPTLAVYYDFDEGEGGFVVASVGHSVEVVSGISLNLGASASYDLNNKVMGYDKNGDEFSNFYNAEVSASVTIPVDKSFSIEPSVAYSFPLSNDAEDALQAINDDGDKDIIYGGLTVTLSF